jgi:hypothetical protein
MVKGKEEDIFKAFIESLDLDLSEKGLDSPELEDIIDDTEEVNGNVLKVTFDLHLFMNHRQKRYFMLTSNQKMQDLGGMSLKDAIVKFNSKQQRRKR